MTMASLGIQPTQGGMVEQPVTDSLGGVRPEEDSRVANAREKSASASQPDSGRVIAERK